MTDYDTIPFSSYPSPERTPGRMATIADLFGVHVPDPEKCSVLSLGCGTGADLVWLAAMFPECSFSGVDQSKEQILHGQKHQQALGLSNVSLYCADLLKWSPEEKTYDYIICHGVYSWVPDDVRKKIFELATSHLSQNGIFSLSYNALPGWNVRGAIRDLLRANNEKGGAESRIARAREIIKLLLSLQEDDYSPYGIEFREELKRLGERRDQYLLHELLAEENTGFYFRDIVKLAEQSGFRYLGDARFSRVRFNRISEDQIQDCAGNAKGDQGVCWREQYMDYVYPAPYRSTLFCRENKTPDRSITLDRVKGMYISSPLVPLTGKINVSSGTPEEFCDPREHTVSIQEPYQKAVLSCLKEVWPASVRVSDLPEIIQERTGDTYSDQDALHHWVLDFCSQSLIDISLLPSRCAHTESKKPFISEFIRYQAKHETAITNLRNEYIEINSFHQMLLPLLDGAHTEEKLCEEMQKLLESTGGGFRVEGKEITDPEEQKIILKQQVSEALKFFLEGALLSHP